MIRGRKEGKSYATWFIGFDHELPLVASGSNGVSRPVSRASSLESLLPASRHQARTRTPDPLLQQKQQQQQQLHQHQQKQQQQQEDKDRPARSKKTTKDVYREAFENAKKVEEARFKAKFDSLIADVRKSLDTQSPDQDLSSTFGSTSYAEVMISFRSRLRELLVGHSQRLQLAYESFDMTQNEADHGPAVRKNVSTLVENLVGETLDLQTSDEAVSDLSSLSEDSPPDQQSFADHIAQVIVAKILDSHRREVGRTISSENHEDHGGQINGLDLPDSGHDDQRPRPKPRLRRHSDDDDDDEEGGEEEDDDVSDVVRQFEELRNFAQTAGHVRPQPVARDIEERVSPSPVEESPLQKVSVDSKEEAQDDFLTRCHTYDRVHGGSGPDFSQFDALTFGTGEVDPDLLSMNLAIIPEETEEELEQEGEEGEEGEGGGWKENWIFKGSAGFSPYDNCASRKIRTEDGRPLYMMVPQPDDNLIPRIGNRDADQLSDLSENEDGKSTDDHSDEENTFYSRTSEELRRISRKSTASVQTEESDLDSPRSRTKGRRDSGTQADDLPPASPSTRPVDVSLDSSLPLVPRLRLLEELIPADNDDPKFLVPPESAAITEGEVLKLSCRVAGTPPVGVFWYQETEEVEELEEGEDCDISSEGDRHTLTLYNLRRDKAGQFMCIALNDVGKCTQYFTVTVKENKQDLKAPEFLKGIQDVEVREGQSVKFRCKVKGIPLPRVNWFKDGRLLRSSRSCRIEKFGNRDYLLTIDCASMEDDAEYTVVARNIRGEAKSSAQVIVEPAGEAPSSRLGLTPASRLQQQQPAPLTASTAADSYSAPPGQQTGDSLDRLTRRMSEERDRMTDTASKLLGTAEEEKSAKSVRLLTSSALDVLRAAEEIIESERQEGGQQEFVTSTPRTAASPTSSSRNDVINNNNDVTFNDNDVTSLGDVSMTTIESRDDNSVLYLSDTTLGASSTTDGPLSPGAADQTDSARRGGSGDVMTSQHVDVISAAAPPPGSSSAHSKRPLGGGEESSLDTSYVTEGDTSADLSLSDFAIRPEDYSGGEEVLNFGPKPVNAKRYRRDYVVPGAEKEQEGEGAGHRHWDVKMNAYSPSAEIVNKKGAANKAEEEIYLAAGKVFGLEARVRELQGRVEAAGQQQDEEAELQRLEEEVARAVAQSAQSERDVSTIEFSVSQLRQEEITLGDKGDNSSSQASTPRQSVDSGFSSLRESTGRGERPPPPPPVVLVGHTGEGDVPASRGEYNLEEGMELPSVHRLRAMFSQQGQQQQQRDSDLGDGSFTREGEDSVHSITARSLAKTQQSRRLQQQQQQQQHQGDAPPHAQVRATSTAQLQLSPAPNPASLHHVDPPSSGPGLPRALLRRSQVGADSSTYQPLEPEKDPVLIYPKSSSKSHPAPAPPHSARSPHPTPTPTPRQTATATKVTAASAPKVSPLQSTAPSQPAGKTASPATPCPATGAAAAAAAATKKAPSPKIRSGCISARAAFWEKRINDGNVSDCAVAEEFPDMLQDEEEEESQA